MKKMGEYSYEDLKRDVRKKLEELWVEENSFEVIITYDCIESNFRNKLRDGLLKGKYKAVPLSESTYYLPEKQTIDQCHAIGKEIVDLFSETLNESKTAAPNSVVRIIVPNGKVFGKIEIPLKS